jgi:farnesyl diphosphate synthase
MGVATGRAGVDAQRHLVGFGASLGLAFQVVDDILDVTTDSATLGKTAGKDAASDKPTFVSLMGLAGAQAYADTLLDQAHQNLDASGLNDTDNLHALTDWVGRRVS